MKIGIIGAMEVEIASLKKQMNITQEKTIARMIFIEGTIGTQEVVLVRSGVGKVNAGVCAQLLITVFHVTHVLNTGVAGSLNNDINIGDLVVSKDAMYHDVHAEVFGYQSGEIPQLGIVQFPADETLRKLAVEGIRKAAPDVQVFEGRILSGDAFIADHQKKMELREQFHGDCTEMEGTAIAQVCWLNQISFVIIRAISDKADESVQVSYDEFEAKAAEHCASLVFEMLKKMN